MSLHLHKNAFANRQRSAKSRREDSSRIASQKTTAELMGHEDQYRSYDELSAFEEERRDGRGDYRVEVLSEGDRNQEVAIIAPHGGKIERHTSKIARQIAGDEFCLYLFEGTKPTNNFSDLHITSTRFDEPRCVELVEKAKTVVAVHGKKEPKNGVLVGGRADELAERIAGKLREAEFGAERITSGPVCGMKKANICNRTRTGKGVQLEIYRGLRKRLGSGSEGRLETFARAVREALFSSLGSVPPSQASSSKPDKAIR